MARLSKFAERTPVLYLCGAVLLAALGYLWLFLFPALTLLLLIKLPIDMWQAERTSDWLAVGAYAALLVLCVWVSIDLWRCRTRTPGGQRLTRARFPQLWARIDHLTTEYGTDPIDVVCVNNLFDVELEHTPQRGLPLTHHNTLTLGLPLLQALSTSHLDVLLARKISLLPAGSNWPYAWLYHLRTAWHRYNRDLQGMSPGRIMVSSWFSWYAPLYIRYTLFVARRCELIADRNALKLYDEWAVEEAITTATIRKSFVENKLWPALLRMSQKYPNPPLLPYSSMEQLIDKELDSDRSHRLLDGLLLARARDDSHMPTLKQRWASLSLNRPRVPVPVRISAATTYLRGALRPLQEHYDKGWLRTTLPDWKERHAQAQRERERLQNLLDQLPQELLSNEDVWECTVLVRQYMGQTKAVQLYKSLLATEPTDPRVYFNIGSFLLSCRDEQGVEVLERAMSMDDRYTPDACELISEFMQFTGERRRAKTYQRRAVNYSDAA